MSEKDPLSKKQAYKKREREKKKEVTFLYVSFNKLNMLEYLQHRKGGCFLSMVVLHQNIGILPNMEYK